MNLICFEYTLLEFNKLIEWIYAPKDEFRKKSVQMQLLQEKNWFRLLIQVT